MKLSAKGAEFIASHEGCLTRAYDDLNPYTILTPNTKIKGTLTIGCGHTGNVDGKPIRWDTKITKEKAYQLLQEDITAREKKLTSLLKKKVTQNMFDALLSYVYNCGFGNTYFVLAIAAINKGNYEDAASYIKNGTQTSKGVILNGLKIRRNDEYELFIDGMDSLKFPYKVIILKTGVKVREEPSIKAKTIKKLNKNKVCVIVAEKTYNGIKFGQLKKSKHWIRLKWTARK